MKAKSIRLTTECKYCGCPITYKTENGYNTG